MQDYFLESRGIAYRSNGVDPAKKTLLFVHGLSGSASAWALYEERFEKDFNVVTFDLRGHALSQRPRRYRDYALEMFVDDIRALLEHLHIAQCTVVAHSFGTIVARDFILHYPACVSGVIFLAAPYRLWDTWHRYTAWSAFVARWIAELSPLPLPRGKRTDYLNWGYAPDWQLRRIAPEVYRMGVRSYLRCLCRQYADRDQGWDKITVPSMLVHGSDDSFVPVSQAHTLKHVLTSSTLEILPGANHMLVLNNVAEVCRIIVDFVG